MYLQWMEEEIQKPGKSVAVRGLRKTKREENIQTGIRYCVCSAFPHRPCCLFPCCMIQLGFLLEGWRTGVVVFLFE